MIDGHKRIAALEQLGRDTVEATVWAMSEAEALLLSRSLRFSPQESALEQGWLLAEMEQRFGYSLDELARRFDRSASWVSRRLALVELLPETIQQQVREGKLGAQVAMKYLVPVARVNVEDCAAHGRRFRPASLRHAASRTTLCRLAGRLARGPRTHPRRAGTVFENAAAGAGRQAGGGRQVERELEMALAILHRAGRRLAEALPEMTGPQQEQAQGQMETARRELDRMAERIGKEQEAETC